MIKIKIIVIGKDKDKWVTEGIDHFTKLIARYAKIQWDVIPNLKDSSSLTPNEVMQKEADLIRKKIGDRKFIAMTDKGNEYNSIVFSEKLHKIINTYNSRLMFIVGGAYGLDKNLLREASSNISLSKLTFSHQLVRLVLMEQLFRAFSILNNTDYHK